MAVYGATIFVSAFLLFQVEPMMGKFFLPWFGGAQTVWTTCILFFQMLLLGGYAYAHLIGTFLQPRQQAVAHLALVSLCLVLMMALAIVWPSPITPPAHWKPADPGLPTLRILMLLSVSVGLPFLVLSTTAPLLQAWFAKSLHAASPYRMYAWSNLGAMLGLLTYPFVLEPALSLQAQARLWALLYAVFALGIVGCAWTVRSAQLSSSVEGCARADLQGREARPTSAICALWIALAACASLMFLAVTNQLCQDVAAIPFLWVLPLAIYLLSFIVCFGNEYWYRRGIFNPALAGAIVLACAVLNRPHTGIAWQIAIYAFLIGTACMVCHGELIRLKPAQDRLTFFYLMVSAGGALGGLFAAVIAPWLFRGYWELQLSIWACAVLLIMALGRDEESWLHERSPALAIVLLACAMLLPELILLSAGKAAALLSYNIAALVALIIVSVVILGKHQSTPSGQRRSLVPVSAIAGLLILGSVLLTNVMARLTSSLITGRNFYGAFAVVARDANDPAWHSYMLRHGLIVHGVQFPEPDKRYQTTTYYGPASGVGLLMLHHPRRLAADAHGRTLRLGVVGLGVGTVAAYGGPGDYIRFYEINPAIINVATDPNGYFTYLRDSRARVDIVAGDARLSMEREVAGGHSQHFDILVIDAFSGDSIPVHLLTAEAFSVYLRELKPDGVLALHITNGYLDFRPVARQLARHFDLGGAWVHSQSTSRLTENSDWVLLARNGRVLDQPAISAQLSPLGTAGGMRMWSDDYSNLLQILK